MWIFGCSKKNERKIPEKKVKIFVTVKSWSLGREKMFELLVTFGWALCCETWLKFGFKVLRCREKKSLRKKNVWVVCYPVSWSPCWLKSSITWANWKGNVKIAFGDRKKMLVTEKIWWNFAKCFSGRGLCLTHVGAPCCKTWLKEEIAEIGITIAKKI